MGSTPIPATILKGDQMIQIPILKTYDSIVAPIRKVKVQLKLYREAMNTRVANLTDKKIELSSQIDRSVTEINKAQKTEDNIDNLLG